MSTPGDTRFIVDLPELDRLLKDLDSAKGELDNALKALKGAASTGLGLAELDSACDHFQSKWGYGLKQLGDDAKALHDGLDSVLKAYHQTEEGLAAMLQGNGAAKS